MSIEITPGYKQTELGIVPEDWQIQSLPEALQFISGKAHEQFINEAGPYVVVNSKFISTEGGVRKYSSENFCPAKRGDVLMVMSDLPNGRALAKCYLVKEDKTYAVNQRVCIFRPAKGSSEYFYYFLNRNKYFMQFDDGVQQTHLLNPMILNCQLKVPPEPEQYRIGQTLSDIDSFISSLDQLIAKKRDIQQATMQQLLAGQRRLPGFSGAWEVKKLGDIASLNRINVIPFATPDKIFTHFSLPAFDEGMRPVKESGTTIGSNKFSVPASAILVSKLNPRIPRVWLPQDIPANAVASTEFLVLTPRDGTEREFLYVVCKSSGFCAQMELAATGTTGSHQRISPGNALSLSVNVPSEKSEQSAIATILFDMDTEIASLESRLEKTRQLKQGMMQELLTGRIRLTNQGV